MVKKTKKRTNKKGGGLTLRNMKKCSPANKDNNFSCFNKKQLIKILNHAEKYYNKKLNFSEKNTLEQLWNKLNDLFKEQCNTEWCWLKTDVIRLLNDKSINKETFRPRMPKKWYTHPREWLTTLDIEYVMKQYQDKHNDFIFIGPVPIDFDFELSPGQCVINELCKINIKQLNNKGINKLGVVFNLDKHNEPGSHWVALYANIMEGGIYYYDSYGIEPPDEVTELMNRLQDQTKEYNNKVDKRHNNIRHQHKNSECGVYSMNFIIELLNGKTFDEITQNAVSDDEMQKNRDKYYVRI